MVELGSVTLKRIGFFCFPIKHSTHSNTHSLKRGEPAHAHTHNARTYSHTNTHTRATITAGKGWGICQFTQSQACRARPRTMRHARICNGAPVLIEAPTPESSLRGHRSHNCVGSDVASVATAWTYCLRPRVSDISTEVQTPARDNHSGQLFEGMG